MADEKDNTIYVAVLAPLSKKGTRHAENLVDSADHLGHSIVLKERVVETPNDIKYGVILRLNPDQTPDDLFQLLFERLQGLSMKRHKQRGTGETLETIAIHGLTTKENWLGAFFGLNGSGGQETPQAPQKPAASQPPTPEPPKLEQLKTPLQLYVAKHPKPETAGKIQKSVERYLTYFEKEFGYSYYELKNQKPTMPLQTARKHATTTIACMLRRKYDLPFSEIGEITEMSYRTIWMRTTATKRLRLTGRDLNNPEKVYEKVVGMYKRAKAKTKTHKKAKRRK